jgi:hypothetical protein
MAAGGCRSRRLAAAASCAVLLSLGGAGGAARAMLFEEFEVFAPPGGGEVGGLEIDQHVNYGFRGHRGDDDDRALPTERGTYLNTEISYTVSPAYAVALELPSAITADGRLHNGGFKLRNLVRLHAGSAWSYGVLVELQRQPRGFAAHPWGLAVSPLIAWQSGPWQARFNLGVGGTVGRRGSESFLEPAARLTRDMGAVLLGLEYYGEVGRLERTERFARQGHQLLAITEIGLGPALMLRLGIGRGLTPASERWVGTVVLGFDF